MQLGRRKGWQGAIQHRNRLLTFHLSPPETDMKKRRLNGQSNKAILFEFLETREMGLEDVELE
jgi:hypothetical protein